MTKRDGFSARRSQALNRLHARWAGLAKPAQGFVSQPEPRTIGMYARGRQLVAGNFLFCGPSDPRRPDLTIWDISMPDPAFEDEVQGFAWLDDLAAVGDAAARKRAQDWTWGWIARFGRGQGPGWTPDLTGRRVIRWINHALFLLNGRDRTATAAYLPRPVAPDRVPCPALAHRRPRPAPVRGADRADLRRAGADRDGAARRPRPRRAGAGLRSRDRRRGRHPHAQPRGTAGGVHPADLGRAGADREPGDAPRPNTSLPSSASRRPCAPCAMPMAGSRAFTAAARGWRGGWTRRWPARASSPRPSRAGRWALRGCRAVAPA